MPPLRGLHRCHATGGEREALQEAVAGRLLGRHHLESARLTHASCGTPSAPGRLPHACWAKLHADPGSLGMRQFGYGVFPRSLATSAHDEEVSSPERKASRSPTAAGPQEKSTGRSQRDDGNHGVLRSPTADRVSVPRHAVSTISVKTEPHRAKRLAEFALVVRAQNISHRRESGIRQGIILPVEGHQAWNIHYSVIHPALFGSPRGACQESLEQEVGAGYPVAVKFHPGSACKEGALDAHKRLASNLGLIIQKGGLEDQSHPLDNSVERTYVRHDTHFRANWAGVTKRARWHAVSCCRSSSGG